MAAKSRHSESETATTVLTSRADKDRVGSARIIRSVAEREMLKVGQKGGTGHES